MSTDTHYVPAIGQIYRFTGRSAVFEDGVEYSMAEMLYLARKGAKEELAAIHKVKKIFDGVIIVEKDDLKRGHHEHTASRRGTERSHKPLHHAPKRSIVGK